MDPRAEVQRLLVQGDNRLKQGGSSLLGRARESYEAALAVAREHGLEERVGPLVALRLEELDRLERDGQAD